ncbi:hypothetical protein HK098_004256 [Nowakowskiella sp. JEL0407]|nr:hypothetical protein HK098_004256 [Nowakowskiella sp. JEL0407]
MTKRFEVFLPHERVVQNSEDSRPRYKLLELPPGFPLSDSLNSTILFKGLPTDDAVICTESHTYLIRQVNTSNTMAIVNQQEEIYNIVSTTPSYLELIPTPPKLDRLKECLYESLVFEPDGVESDERLYEYNELVDIVQASEKEIRMALKQLDAINMNGYVRIISPPYLSEILTKIIDETTEMGLDLRKDVVSATHMINKIDDVDSELIVHCLNIFSERNAGEVVDLDSEWDTLKGMEVKLSEWKVCKFIGKHILLGEKNGIELEKFMSLWNIAIPSSFEVDIQMLKGMCIIENSSTYTSSSTIIQHIPFELSPDPKQRISQLFELRTRWKGDDLAPFLLDFIKDVGNEVDGLEYFSISETEKKKFDALLLKYCRKVKEGQEDVVYVQR